MNVTITAAGVDHRVLAAEPSSAHDRPCATMHIRRISPAIAALAMSFMVVAISACSGSGGSAASPGSSSQPAASPSAADGPVTTPDQAIARVIAAEPRLAGIKPFDPNAIGQSAWYKVEPASGIGAFIVTIRLGWGDCPAGCINEHMWLYSVAPDGTVQLQSQGGDSVAPEAWPAQASGGGSSSGLSIRVTAGPTCPVERPNDPACAPRPVAGAIIVIRDAGGAEKGSVTSGADGTASVQLPAGEYTLEPRPVQGLMGTAAPMRVTVGDGGPTEAAISYDTGIR